MVSALASTNLGVSRIIAESRSQLEALELQLASGKKVKTYSELGSQRSQILALRSSISQIDAFQTTITQADLRLTVLNQSLSRVQEIAALARTDALATGFELHASGQTVHQTEAGIRFDETVALLNSHVDGRYLLGGRETEQAPVRPAAEILDGVGGQAGFRQVSAERRAADLGADGRGRLAVPPLVGSTASLAEDVAGHPFGFKLAAVDSSLGGTVVAGPAGSPASIDVTFSATLPSDGESLQVTLDLPDGTQAFVELTARAGTAGPGEFSIGADAATTAANFRTALDQAIQDEAQRGLSAASAAAAANDFFDFDPTTPPQRVDGPPFESATALIDATPADTVIWYQGELSTSPARESAVARADDKLTVAYGVRANEEPFTTTLKQLALLTVETFSETDPAASDRFEALTSRAADALAFPGNAQSIESVVIELSVSQAALQTTSERHTANKGFFETLIGEAENSDIYEVSAQILSLQGRIEASLQVTASMSRLSLTNFL